MMGIESLKEKTDFWMSMGRATEEQRIKAEEYYEKELMPLIIESFIGREENNIVSPEYMILSVGTSYEPLVLSLKLVKPKKVLFLYTEDTEEKIDKILQFVPLKSSEYRKEKVEKSNTLLIYQKIKQAYYDWGKPQNVFIDFTGGTKAMSAATAMAGAILGAQLIYIGNKEYLGLFRKPYPGTEFLEKIPNPYSVFGDIEEDRANDLLHQHDYAGARKIFEALINKVPDPNKKEYFHTLYFLALAYEHWDALEFDKASESMNKLVNEIEKYSQLNSNWILADKIALLRKQRDILNIMAKNATQIQKNTPMELLVKLEEILSLMFTIYHNAKRRSEQAKYDMASLLLYRLLEMIMQRRLALYGIDTSKPQFSKVFLNQEKLNDFTNKVINYRRKLFGKNVNKFLPTYVTLMEGYIELAVLKDALIDEKDVLQFLKEVFEKVKIRNYNIFAHGFCSLRKEDYIEFEKFVIGVFERFCEIESVNIKEYKECIKFIHPEESKYYQ
ncbi:TIGR02710 family CRISPR-associated CARF protein [Defluviitalea raffinosedens]|uniref:TIGR02710 family CRISPR-associated CARF protein n=1 Tax=Defluviitalea raffinosedens TaxID=1450156 RepID=UPI001956F57B|nr:TIGR02710 family CRISPR-associated CARF protein [Defluviitalea raffinosedens]MBM7685891.1 CRISPR-associated protein (TIGR02710 family) [Defluviitalea raffinosedens]